VVYRNVPADIAVVETRGVRLPALQACARDLEEADVVAAVGFAYVLSVPFVRHGHVSVAHAIIPDADPNRFFIVTDMPLIGGMSGGPMLSGAGCVAGINQMSNNTNGLGLPVEVITALTGQFWGK
jgi:S1-C subfamily serine protease